MPGREVEAQREKLKNSITRSNQVRVITCLFREKDCGTWPEDAGQMPRRRAGGDRACKGTSHTTPGRNCGSSGDTNADVS